MYFIPRNNRLYAFFIARPLYAWYGITAALILLCCFMWAVAVYLPVHAHWQSLAVQQSFLIEQRNRCEVVKRDIEQLSLDTQSLSGTLKDLMHTYQSHAGA
ncbi:MAG TPA: hypothetical protein VI522_07455, partial [Gammaproteobacteria bacterium]|nr:hypothetical protein [Gammaproteobacteria bacterium]